MQVTENYQYSCRPIIPVSTVAVAGLSTELVAAAINGVYVDFVDKIPEATFAKLYDKLVTTVRKASGCAPEEVADRVSRLYKDFLDPDSDSGREASIAVSAMLRKKIKENGDGCFLRLRK